MKTREFIHNSIQNFHHLMYAFQMEAIETQMMFDTFHQIIRHKWFKDQNSEFPNDLQIKQALNQLSDLPKFLPFLAIVFLPLPGVTELYLLAAITLERQLNGKVSLLPSQFRKLFHKNQESFEQ